MSAPRARERGQATVEFALILPILAMAILAVLQVALVVRDRIAVVHAAREAARAASVEPDPSGAIRAARRSLPGAEVHVGRRGKIGEPIAVVVTFTSHTDLPLVGPLFPDPVLESRVVMRIER